MSVSDLVECVGEVNAAIERGISGGLSPHVLELVQLTIAGKRYRLTEIVPEAPRGPDKGIDGEIAFISAEDLDCMNTSSA